MRAEIKGEKRMGRKKGKRRNIGSGKEEENRRKLGR